MSGERWQVFLEIHSGLAREGPGSRESTARAYAALPDKHNISAILDIGCGPGESTLHLAGLSAARITAVDTHQPYLDRLQAEAVRSNLADRILILNADMANLSFADEVCDCIWSEGAIYNIGFREGLRRWKRLLQPEGAIAVSELCWLRDDPPDDLFTYWSGAYPDIAAASEKREIFKSEGYQLLDSFVLPRRDWLEEYYGPLEKRLARMHVHYADNRTALEVIAEERREIEVYRRWADYFGYLFLIGRVNR